MAARRESERGQIRGDSSTDAEITRDLLAFSKADVSIQAPLAQASEVAEVIQNLPLLVSKSDSFEVSVEGEKLIVRSAKGIGRFVTTDSDLVKQIIREKNKTIIVLSEESPFSLVELSHEAAPQDSPRTMRTSNPFRTITPDYVSPQAFSQPPQYRSESSGGSSGGSRGE